MIVAKHFNADGVMVHEFRSMSSPLMDLLYTHTTKSIVLHQHNGNFIEYTRGDK